MSWHGDQLKSALGISALVSIYGISALAVWFLGSFFGIGVVWQIVLITLILLTWPVAVLIKHFRKKRETPAHPPATATKGQSAAKPRPPERPLQLPAPTGTYEELTRGTEETVHWLRGTKLGGVRANDAVYALPWFIIAGPPASGKTSLLLSSGFDFHALPSQRAVDQNRIRPTANCDWRVADEAILLDTTGRYQTDGAERDEWAALLETIKQYRKARPLDGFVIAVNAVAVLGLSDIQIEQQAKILRARLDEAMQRTQTRFPVYLVFTHMDAIEGFTDFFRSFNLDERAQVWGTTIPLAQQQNAHALFDTEFDHLHAKLLRRRTVQLGTLASSNEQLRSFKFPGRFRRARNRLGLFATILFRPHPFSTQPLLRGFYFTSSNGRAGHSAGEEYFTRNFFKEVLLRDKDLLAATQARRRNPRLKRNLLLAGAGALLLAFFVGMLVSYSRNKQLIADALARGQELSEITKTTSKDSVITAGELEAMESVREMLDKLDDSPPQLLRLLQFGLYSGDDLNAEKRSILRHVYFEAVNRRFLQPTISKLEADLRAFASGAKEAPSGTASTVAQSTVPKEEILGRHYDHLRAYLMLEKRERVEPTFLSDQLKDYWEASSPPGMGDVSRRQLDFYTKQASSQDASHHKVDESLVSQVKNKLVEYPVNRRVYKEITDSVNAKFKTISLDTLGAREGSVLDGNPSVPGSYTVDGRREVLKEFETAPEQMREKYDWVMERLRKDQSDDVRKEELTRMYYRDYLSQWQKFLQDIKVREFDTKDNAVKTLRVLSGIDSPSPLESVMQEVVRQTKLSEPTKGSWLEWLTKPFTRKTEVGTGGSSTIEDAFRPISDFLSASKEKPSPMSEYLTTLKRIGVLLNREPLDKISRAMPASDPIGLRKAQDDLSELLEAKGFNKKQAGDTAATLLKQPFDNLNKLLGNVDYAQIEKAWQQLHRKAQEVESGFPFTNDGEVPTAKLARFFNPKDGELTKFFNQQLKSHFEEDWTPKPEAADKFSQDFVNYLKNARRLHDALFPSGREQPKVDYSITLQSVPDTLITITIDGNTVSTRDELSSKLTWPGGTGSQLGARIKVVTNSGQEEESPLYEGEWGLLKMFRAGGGEGAGDQFDLQWNVGPVPVRATLRTTSGNIFQHDLFKGLRAPKSLR